jgi:hypothetical protein
LVIQIQAVADELFDFDLGWAVEAALSAMRRSIATIATVATTISTGTAAAVASTGTPVPASAATLARRAIFTILRCWLVSHFLN